MLTTSFRSIALYTFTIVSIVIPLVGSQSQSNNVPAARSPCPAVFEYEPPGAEDDRWYGTIKLMTEYDLHGVWIDIILDNKADLLGNWFGDVTTKDNQEFKIENKNEILRTGKELTVRIFVKFGLNIPRITSLRLNGRDLCAAESQSNDGQSHGSATPKRYNNNNAQELPKILTRPTQTSLSGNRGTLQSDMGVSWDTSGRELSSPYSQGAQTNDTTRRPANRPSTTSTSKKSKLSDYDNDNAPSGNRGAPSRTLYPLQSDMGVSRDTSGREISSPYSQGTQSDDTARRSANRPSTISTSKKSKLSDYDNDNAPSSNQAASSNNLYPLPSDMGVSRDTSGRELSSPYSRGTQTDDTTRRPANRPSTTSTTKKSELSDYDFDNDENSPREEDYFSGDFNPPSSGNKKSFFTQTTSNQQCGKVAAASVTLITQGIRTQVGQFPWHVAIYRMKHVDSTYICGGSLVSQDYVLTAAHCVTTVTTRLPINKNILTLHFGKSNLRTSVEGVQVKFVDHLFVHPDYASLTTGSDIAVMKLRSPVDFTNHVRAVCLWPENTIALKNVIGKPGTVVGWGFDEEGELTENLRYANMPVIDELTCIRSFEEFFIKVTSNTTFCAGYLNGTSVCNGDSGGGMVFSMGPSNNPTWYLRGLVSLSAALQNQARCDPSHYIVFTDVAQFLPWIKSVMQPTRSRHR